MKKKAGGQLVAEAKMVAEEIDIKEQQHWTFITNAKDFFLASDWYSVVFFIAYCSIHLFFLCFSFSLYVNEFKCFFLQTTIFAFYIVIT